LKKLRKIWKSSGKSVTSQKGGLNDQSLNSNGKTHANLNESEKMFRNHQRANQAQFKGESMVKLGRKFESVKKL
jgi:hypothetical protein